MFFRKKEKRRIVQDCIERSYDNANAIWREEANNAVYRLAKRRKYITSEDVIDYLHKRSIYTTNLSALGGVMYGAYRKGILEHHGYKQSTRRSRHHAPIRVWKSRLKR